MGNEGTELLERRNTPTVIAREGRGFVPLGGKSREVIKVRDRINEEEKLSSRYTKGRRSRDQEGTREEREC